MAWVSTSLASAMGDTITKAQATLADAQDKLNGVSTQINKVTSNLNSVIDSLNLNKDQLSASAQAGFYFIILSPKTGGWNSRLGAAMNHPLNTGYSAGFATIMNAPTLTGLEAQLSSMIDALTKKFNFGSMSSGNWSTGWVDDWTDFLPDISVGSLPSIPDVDFALRDVWVTTPLGGIFKGNMDAIVEDINSIADKAKSVLDLSNQLGRRANSASAGLGAVSDFLDDLETFGVYNITLPPADGGYLSRLTSEAGAPPTNSAYYSCGIACIAEASYIEGISGLITKFNSLQTIKGA